MRKTAILIVFLFTSFYIFPQNIRETKIFVPPVDGIGNQGDNAFFYWHLTYEVVLQHHALTRMQRGSDFMLRGTIKSLSQERTVQPAVMEDPFIRRNIRSAQNTPERREFISMETDNNIHFFDTAGGGPVSASAPVQPPQRSTPNPAGRDDLIFELELVEVSSLEVLGKQHIIYRNTDASVRDLLTIIVYNMLSGIPDIQKTADWRDKWLFLEASALWVPSLYSGNYQSLNWVNFGLRFAAEYHFLNFMSVDSGVQFVQDWVVISAARDVEYRDLILQIPLALKFVLKPFDHFMLEPYGGIALNLSLLEMTQPSLFSWFLGFQFGVRAGPGIIVIDPRFNMDFFNSVTSDGFEYKRFSIQFGIGYKFGILPKRIHPLGY
ncbi:MAG: hypothetical protein FWD40_05030 [Treponema sp.]|nr:hypothetical protein [Treponema sp.]